MEADGELSARQAAQIRLHLAACYGCRVRKAEIERTMDELAHTHHECFDPQVPPSAGPRALLRARLAALGAMAKPCWWQRLLPRPAMLPVCLGLACLAAALLAGLVLPEPLPHRTHLVTNAFEQGTVPDRRLTPGVTRHATVNEVCSMAREEVVRVVPTTLRQAVFHEYGMANVPEGDYEIDYLITPGLGGAQDIHNLWPQPYRSSTWNAQVKDALEEHLHEMVCAGELDLSTAQHDIADNWIQAYQKYFHTNSPLAAHFRSN
jgi:hypothetical protein